MALLNPPNILPEAMRFLVRAVIASRARLSEEALVGAVAPTGMVEALADGGQADGEDEEPVAGGGRAAGTTIAKCSLTALRQLRLVTVSDDAVALSDTAAAIWRKAHDVTPASFVKELEEAILSDAGRRVSDDLIGACAVLSAAESPLRAFDAFDENAASRRFVEHQRGVIGTDLQAEWAVGNKERWQSFRRIGTYLGWIEPMDVRARFGVVPNSSSALRRWVASVSPGTYAAVEFLEMASGRLPFLDGGSCSYRRLGQAESLSGGLSLSLLSLNHAGDVQLVKEADATTYAVSIEPGNQMLFSHVTVPAKTTKRSRS